MDQRQTKCSECKKKIGLFGFACKCRDSENKYRSFCSTCKIPKQTDTEFTGGHVCTFDYRSYGRELFEKSNPCIKMAKVEII